ncbi:MAG: response regulator [Betaproteobacteria bacterium]|nr:response regulator [Betaproteobacteria bacterium]
MDADLKRVMLVEDDDDIRAVAGMALEMVGGLAVRACGSGAEALAAVAEFAPQLVVLDVMMPRMNGSEVLVQLRAQEATAKIPVVFLTAKAQREEVERLRALGVLDVVEKPFDPMTLSDTLKALWAKRPVE